VDQEAINNVLKLAANLVHSHKGVTDTVWGIASVLGPACESTCVGCEYEHNEAVHELHKLYRLLGEDTNKLPYGPLPYPESTDDLGEAARQSARLRGQSWPDNTQHNAPFKLEATGADLEIAENSDRL
jgi:hypothetical protein